MLLKLFVGLIILVGIFVGVLAIWLPREQFIHLIVFRDFLDVSLPVLAFGALVKYLCTCPRSTHVHACHDKNCKENNPIA